MSVSSRRVLLLLLATRRPRNPMGSAASHGMTDFCSQFVTLGFARSLHKNALRWKNVCVCVYRLNRRKTSSLYYIIYGRGQRDLQLWPLPTKLHTGDQVNVPACPALGAFKTQLGGHNIFFAVVLYCHCPLWSIYIYRILIRLLSNLHVSGFGSCRII